MTQKYYAHSKDGRPPQEWQGLEEHMKNVAEMVRGFAGSVWGGGVGVFGRNVARSEGYSR